MQRPMCMRSSRGSLVGVRAERSRPGRVRQAPAVCPLAFRPPSRVRGKTMAESAACAALPVGRTVTVRRTVSESDVYLFAGLTGDHSPNHTDEEYMRRTRYGRRIAHGAPA